MGNSSSSPPKMKPIHVKVGRVKPLRIPKVNFNNVLKDTAKGFEYLGDKLSHPKKTIAETKRALNKLDASTGGTLGIVYQGAQIYFPAFGTAVTLASVADEMIANDGKLSKQTLASIILNQATGGQYGNYQNIKEIEKTPLMRQVEKDLGVSIGELPVLKVKGNVVVS